MLSEKPVSIPACPGTQPCLFHSRDPSVLHLYQSNQLETLGELLFAVLGQPQANPLAAETVIVQAKGMGRWLTFRIAERFGVCANVQFPLPASFLWQLVETVLGRQEKQGGFSADALAWRLDALLRDAPPAGLAEYLQDGNPRKRWRLAMRVADVFDQYLVYRPHWLAQWETGRLCGLGADEAWQAGLWRKLSADRESPHRADLLERLIARLRGREALALPERIVLFGISSLAPKVVEVLAALGTRIEVCFFALNPCQEAWGDVSRASLEGDGLEVLSAGHRLLAAWGAQGRAFFDGLIECEPTGHALFADVDPFAPASLLTQLQMDILTLSAASGPRLLADNDRSVAVHVCHSPMRQVQALKDALLARFHVNPNLQAGDVAVLCPDIEVYSPYIDAVFSPQAGEVSIPYAIADRGALAASPLLAAWLTLLKWPENQWEVDQVLALLEVPAIARHAGFSDDDASLLRDWLAESGIRRHLGGDAYSWQAGLSRLLLGATTPKEMRGAADDALFHGAYPVADLDLSFMERIARLRRFIRNLADFSLAISADRPMAVWARELAISLDSLFMPDEQEARDLQAARDVLAGLGELAVKTRLATPVARVAVQAWLSDKLAAPSGAGGFLTGGVTFAQLMPMRNLPFKVIAILGLEDASFPRDAPAEGFDLMARNPLPGDRARRLDDRWLFLETLLAAREALLLFYAGRDLHTDVALPPSTVIADLLDVIRRDWRCADGNDAAQALTTQHPLQAFSRRRFASDAPPAFSARWAEIAALAGRGGAFPPALVTGALTLPLPEVVELDDLLRFAGDPCAWLLRRLGAYFERGEGALLAREPFMLEEPTARRLFAEADLQADDGAVLARLGAGMGTLPVGVLGAAWAEQSAAAMQAPLQLWREQVPAAHVPLQFDLEVEGVRIVGSLHGLGSAGMAHFDTRKMQADKRIRGWLQHLLLCVAQPAGVAPCTTQIWRDNVVTLAVVPDAQARLADWLRAYRQAHCGPLPFLPRTSLAYIEGLQSSRDGGIAKAEAAALRAWLGDERMMGEAAYQSVRAVWRGNSPFHEEFAALAERLLSPLLAAQSKVAL